ncbi:response regulator [Methanimicrococcus sp. OttesenSCG-928-J09]|nr:response regulator [Methanimicrococcus sp. OttesenSCG-928-J09]
MKKILLIEDNIMNSELVKDILEMENYGITSVTNGKDALDILETESFDLILTDINLPKLDGLELIKILCESGNIVPVIAMTSDLTTKDGLTFEEVGFDNFIQKPFKIGEFRKLIKSYLDES